MRIRNRVLAFTASSGVVAGACTGETNTTNGSAVAADFSGYSVIRMYAVYRRAETGQSVDLYPIEGAKPEGPGRRLESTPLEREGGRGRREKLPDFADDSVNRYLNVTVNTGRRPLPGAELRTLMNLRPDPQPNSLDLPDARAIQIGQWVVPRPPREGLDSEDIAQLFEIEFGWQVPEGANDDAEGSQSVQRRIEYVPAPGGVYLLGLGGLIARRRRR